MSALIGGYHCAVDMARAPERKTPGSAGYDLAASEDVTIQPGELRLVKTDLVIKAPAGYFTLLAARSSLAKRGLLLANGVGIVDEDYCGPNDRIGFVFLNFSGDAVHVEAGERLGQAVFLPRVDVALHPFSPTATDRGGFGSTGRR